MITVGLTVRAFDSTKALRASDRADLTEAIQQVLRLPTPLRLFVYSRYSLGKGQQGRDPTTIVPTPRYPENARRANVEGKVRLRFVVNADGQGDGASIQVEEATALDFATTVLAAFPSVRFSPMELQGCPLASIVEMPFEFQLRR